jgi:thioesterase domain-containing protein/acyl carrier protein
MIHHRGMINHIYAKIRDLDVSDRDIIAQTASVAFDISVWQYFAALLTGASVSIIDKDIILQHNLFLKVLQRKRVTILETVPSLMKSFLHAIQHESNHRLGDLRWMIPTGESLPVSLVRQWFDMFPAIKLVNAYGPTEASDDVTHCIIDTKPPETQTGISIGRPLQNLHIYILDRDLALCPVGVRGEICVAGVGVGKGYWKNPEITAAAFIPNPFRHEIKNSDCDTLYRTGDIGYYREDGNIECLGRIDYQVKIRGFRIELGEIENRIADYPGIKENVVIDRLDRGGNKYLCAYITAGDEIDVTGLQNHLAKELPDYMVPSHFMQLEKIPLTANGKINRKALPEPEAKPLEDSVPPRDPLEEELAAIWNEVLNRDPASPPLGIDDDFFRIGGHSLRATMLASRIGRTMGVQLPLVEIFKTPTIRDLAYYIRNADITPETMKDERLIPLKIEKENHKQIFFIHDITGEAEIFIELSRHGAAGFNIWGIRTDRLENLAPRNVTIQELAGEYIQSIRRVQPYGPYYLLGWSFGGLIVYEMSAQLEQQNESVIFLGLVDSTPPNKAVENPVRDFTLESEWEFIKRFFGGGAGAEKFKMLSKDGYDQIWSSVADILEDTGQDIDVKKVLFNQERNPMIQYDQFTIRESLHYINVGRTLSNAHERYVPTGKIGSQVQYFKAVDHLDTIDHRAWEALCRQPINYHMVPGNHLSILKVPGVETFVEIFDRALLEVEKN